jgi:DNA-binding GntR family transcriptional regulator
MNDGSARSLPKKFLREETYHQLRRAIIRGDLRPGQQLSEPQLADQFQISRSPIREALGRLERDGFVSRRVNGRIYVAPLDITELQQLYVVRANLEGLATRLAASHLSTADLNEMAGHLRDMRTLAEKGDVDGTLDCGERFHGVIINAARNIPLAEIVAGLRLRISRFRTYIASTRRHDIRIGEHQEILDALYDRDPNRAEESMIRHIEYSADAMLRGTLAT